MKRGTVKAWLHNALQSQFGDECVLFPFSVGSHGYGQVNINNRPELVHRLVCVKFRGEPLRRDMHAAHSCGNKLCINWRHIRWASRSENERDKRLHGRDNCGERHGLSKLRAEEVLAIRNAAGFQKNIAEQFGVSRTAVSDIKRGRRWTHLG